MNANRLLHTAIHALAPGVPSARFVEDTGVAQQRTPAVDRLPSEGRMPGLVGASAWLNSPPLTTAGLRGKVVLIDFWTTVR